MRLRDGREITLRPLGDLPEEMRMRARARLLAERGARMPIEIYRELGRELVHFAILRELPAETAYNLDVTRACHLGMVAEVARAFAGSDIPADKTAVSSANGAR